MRPGATSGPSPADEWPIEADPATGVALPLPPGWVRIDAAIGAVVLATPERENESIFRANLVVSVEAVPEPAGDIAIYSGSVQRGLHAAIPGLHLAAVDTWPWRDGTVGRRVVGAYRQPPHSVVLQQWFRIDRGIATSVSASCAVSQLSAAVPWFDAAVWGLVPATRTGAGG